LGLFHHQLLKLIHEFLYCVLYLCVHLWFMENSICDFKQIGFKGIRRKNWVSGIFVCSFCNLGVFFFSFLFIWFICKPCRIVCLKSWVDW
jgi:hypothetical protein